MNKLIKYFLVVSLNTLCLQAIATTHSFAVFGDVGQFRTPPTVLKNSLLEANIHEVLMAGDNVPFFSPSHKHLWDDWKGKINFFGVAVGNHNQGAFADIEYFKLPGEYYAKTKKDLRIIVLNSNHQETTAGITNQKNFLNDQLAVAKEKFIFIMFHHSPITLSKKHNWKERKYFHREVFPVIQKFKDKITAIFVGHDHIAAATEVDGIPIFEASTARNQYPAQRLDYIDTERKIPVKTVWAYKSGNYWLNLKTNSSNETATFDYFDINKKIVACSIEIKNKKWSLSEQCKENGL